MAKHTNSLALLGGRKRLPFPPVTGTPACVNTLPGRACTLCGSTKWLKRSPKGNGSQNKVQELPMPSRNRARNTVASATVKARKPCITDNSRLSDSSPSRKMPTTDRRGRHGCGARAEPCFLQVGASYDLLYEAVISALRLWRLSRIPSCCAK